MATLTYRPNLSPRQMKALVKQEDKIISQIYQENCSGIEIDIMDIPKIFLAARVAMRTGQDVKETIVSYVQTIRKN